MKPACACEVELALLCLMCPSTTHPSTEQAKCFWEVSIMHAEIVV